MSDEQPQRPYVMVGVYGVPVQSFDEDCIDYYRAEVIAEGLVIGKNGDPRGIGYNGNSEQEAKDLIKADLKDLGFSNKQVKYRRI